MPPPSNILLLIIKPHKMKELMELKLATPLPSGPPIYLIYQFERF